MTQLLIAGLVTSIAAFGLACTQPEEPWDETIAGTSALTGLFCAVALLAGIFA